MSTDNEINEIYLAKIDELELEIARKEQNLCQYTIENSISPVSSDLIFFIIDEFRSIEEDHELNFIHAKLYDYNESNYIPNFKLDSRVPPVLHDFDKASKSFKVLKSYIKNLNLARVGIHRYVERLGELTSIRGSGHTPLIESINLKTDQITLKLLELGADPNQIIQSRTINPTIKAFDSPLMVAARNHYRKFRTIDHLLNFGADPDFRTYTLSHDHQKHETNKAINWILQENFSQTHDNTEDMIEYARVKERLIKETKNSSWETLKQSIRGGIVVTPKDRL